MTTGVRHRVCYRLTVLRLYVGQTYDNYARTIRIWWRDSRPLRGKAREAGKTLLLLACIVLLYGIAGAMDYNDQVRSAAERKAVAAKREAQRYIDCLNGKPLGYTLRHKRSANDYGRTYTFCSTWELKV
jgi:hypothetical protein